ncbi:MAG: hypothetical protein SPI26_05955 [Oscillospiraceae bacterium]|nr:hypothetical protein [Oscillospiraceae bacterium]
MDYIEQIFARAELQQICSFLLYGAERELDTRSYREREEATLRHVISRLQARLPEDEGELSNLVCAYGAACQDVYMEIGLQVGAKLAVQACGNLTPRV